MSASDSGSPSSRDGYYSRKPRRRRKSLAWLVEASAKRTRMERATAIPIIEALETRELLTAVLFTDQSDYAPGSTAIVTATTDGGATGNWDIGETVHFHIDRTDGGTINAPPAVQDWEVTDGVGNFAPYQDSTGMWIYPDTDGSADGQIGTTWLVDPQFAGASLEMTATGLTSGAVAKADFTDASSAQLTSVSLFGQSGTLTYGTAGLTEFQVTAFRSSTGNQTASVTLSTSLPFGATAINVPLTLNFSGNNNSATGFVEITTDNSGTNTPAGTYSLQVLATGANQVGSNFSTLFINRKTLTVTGLSASNKTYNATTSDTLTGTATLLSTDPFGSGSPTDGRPYSGDQVTLTGTAVGTFASKDVANGISVAVGGNSLSGSQSFDYILAANEESGLTANITPKTLFVSGLSASNKVYDATMNATLSGTASLLSNDTAGASTTDGHPYSGDTVSLNSTAASAFTGNFAGKDAANGKVVSVTGNSLTGAQAGDYVLIGDEENGAVTANITPKALTYTGLTVPASKIYDGTTSAVVSGTAALQTAELVGTGSATDGKPYNTDPVGITGTPTGSYNSKDVSGATTVTFGGLSLGGMQASDYTLTASTQAATITAKSLTAQGTLSGGGKTYDGSTTATPSGSAALQSADNTGTGSTLDGKPYSGDTVSLSGTASYAFNTKDVATATTITESGLSLTGTNSGDYTLTAPTLSASIAAKALTAQGTLSGGGKTYDGTTTATPSGSAALQSAESTGTGSTLDGKQYSGDTVSLTGTASYAFNTKDVATATTITESGLSLIGATSGDYTLTAPTLSASITAKALTAQGTLSGGGKTYDGTTAATPSGSAALQSAETAGSGNTTDGKPYSGDTVSLTGTASYAFNTKDVLTATTITESGLSLNGATSGDYTLTVPTLSASITAKALTYTGLSVPASKVYDGTTTAVVGGTAVLKPTESTGSGSTSDGTPYTGDTVSITGTPSGTYNSKDVAAATTVTFGGLSLTGSQASDYSLTALTQAATITAKALTYSGLSVPASKIYDGTTTAVVSGTANLQTAETAGSGSTGDNKPYTGDTVSITGAPTGAYNSKDVASATTVTFGGLSLTGAQASDYSLTASTQAATITPKALSYTGLSAPASKIYDGTTTAVVSGTATLQAAEAPVSGGTSDGTPYSGDSVSLTGTPTGTYNSKDVSTATTVTFGGLSLTGNQASDYSLTASTQAATITPKALSYSGLSVPASKIYDGTTSAVVSGAASLQAAEAAGSGSTSDNKPYTGDTVSITGTPTGTYNSKDVPGATTVTFGGLSLSGAQAGDYSLTASTHAATITPKALTAQGTLSGGGKAYDGTTTATPSGAAALQSTEAGGSGTTSDGKPYTGDTVSLAGTAAYNFNSKDVTTATTITESGLTLSGTNSTDYSPTAPTLSASITARALTVTASDQSHTYGFGGTNASLGTSGFTSSGLQNSETIGSVTLTTNDTTSTSHNYIVGTFTLTPSAATSGTFTASNYNITYANAPTGLTVTAKGLTVGATGVNKTYDGTTTAAVTLSDNRISGDVFTDSYTAANFTDKHVGTGKSVSVTGIGISGADAGNYSFNTTASTTADITTRSITVTADPQTKIYGNADPALTYTVGGMGLANGDTEATTFTGGLTRAAGEHVAGSPYAISQGSLAADSDYNLTQFTGANLTITTRSITVTADPQTKIYGNADPALTYTVGGMGLANGDTEATAFTGGLTRASGEHVAGSPYAISQGTLVADSDYNLTQFTGANLTITTRAITVTADPQTKIYGNADPALTYTVGGMGLANGDTEATAFTGGLTRASGEHVAGSPYAISQGTLAADSDYNLTTFTPANLTITTRSITVTADPQTKIYGNADPALTYTVGGMGLANGDTEATAFSGGLTRASGEHVAGSPYAISQGTLVADSDYNLTQFTGANLNITTRSITVTANPQTKIYGNADPALTYTVGGMGLANGDTEATAFTGGLTRASGEHVAGSPYAISQGTLAADSDYNLTQFTGANLTITTRAITVTADPQTKIYGNADPALTYTVGGMGLANGDTESTAFTGGLTRASGDHVAGSPYAISQGSLAADSDYNLTQFTGANLTITTRAITVTANPQTKIYGNADPALTYTVGGMGLANGDTEATAFTGGLTRASGEHVAGSPYAISQGTLAADSDYNLTQFTGANLTITPRSITVTADPQTKIYGNADPALTYTVGGMGLANGDTEATAFTGGLTRAAGEHVVGSPYAITQGTLAAEGDYNLTTFTPANLTITTRAITVTADPQTKIYGNADPALTYTVGGMGLANGDTEATAFTGGLTRAAGEHVVGSPYAITQGTLAAEGDYNLTTFTPANLTITTRAITVTADPQTKIYGNADPALTYTVGGMGLANGDTEATAFTGGLTRAAGEHVVGSPYAITQGTLAADSDYNLTTFTPANLTITTRAIAVTADPQTKIYGNADPALTYTVGGMGLANGDTEATAFTGGLARAAGEHVAGSPYAISQGTLAADSDYNLTTFTPANLTITTRAITVTADPQTKIYGNADPALTYTVGGMGLANGDTEATAFTGGLTRAAGEHVVGSPYAITQGTLAADSDYKLTTFTPAALTITPASASVTPNSLSKPYGAADPTLTGTLTGFVAADGITATYSRTAGESVGTYTISAVLSPASALSNYAITYNTGTFTITSTSLSHTVVVLSTNAAGAVTASGNATLNLAGTLFVDSSASTAVFASGNAQISAAGGVLVTGGVSKSGNASVTKTGTPAALGDPLGYLIAPSLTGLTNYGAVTVSGNTTKTLAPGIYTSIQISGNAVVTMSAGTYIIMGGGFTVSGNAALTGNGVTIFNAGSLYNGTTDPTNGTFGGITLSGNGVINLSAPATGQPYAGIVIYQSRANTRALNISGNATANTMSGIIYAANAMLTMGGNGKLVDTLVVNSLNISGNVALSQIAQGSDGGDTTGMADTLLAGNLSVYVNDPNGYFTADMLARIDDAISSIDTLLVPYNVTITEVSDPSLANVLLTDATTSATGSAASGVLGCYDPTTSPVTITMLQGWNWYAGADTTAIGASQYDFGTTIAHELGHALGLGGAQSTSSPMNETLPTGVTRRNMSVADLNIPYSSNGADPEMAAGFASRDHSDDGDSNAATDATIATAQGADDGSDLSTSIPGSTETVVVSVPISAPNVATTNSPATIIGPPSSGSANQPATLTGTTIETGTLRGTSRQNHHGKRALATHEKHATQINDHKAKGAHEQTGHQKAQSNRAKLHDTALEQLLTANDPHGRRPQK
jgi:hypothetical protein